MPGEAEGGGPGLLQASLSTRPSPDASRGRISPPACAKSASRITGRDPPRRPTGRGPPFKRARHRDGASTENAPGTGAVCLPAVASVTRARGEPWKPGPARRPAGGHRTRREPGGDGAAQLSWGGERGTGKNG